MRLTINGQTRELPEPLTIADLIAHLDLAGERIAVECNGRILDRDQFASHALTEGDTLEIVRFVGGG
ncbi:sulfur carrier protein ThiS [Alicyclobacillus kakegawensis]|uniref:sulfur carrier protein ThiS n=1 Tax=Alicyclobacillus kakegawensis TaxID=392012 RepID=UPI00082F8B68|nr:sulfur carrier protein ThiS [Alicyclobacillus kakegawensis]